MCRSVVTRNWIRLSVGAKRLYFCVEQKKKKPSQLWTHTVIFIKEIIVFAHTQAVQVTFRRF